jgi:hypothetical protein
VQVHDQHVKTVVTVPAAAREHRDLWRSEGARELSIEPIAPMVDARQQRAMDRFAVIIERPRHDAKVVAKFLFQARKIGDVKGRPFQIGGGRKTIQPRRVDPGGGKFALQVGKSGRRLLGMGLGAACNTVR